MSKKMNLNININRDDVNANDYLYVWSEFGQRPNRISLYNHYEPETFLSLLSIADKTDSSTNTDIIPTGQDYLVNEKVLVRLDENTFVSYSQLDKLTDSKIIGDVSFYFNSKADIQSIIEKISEAEMNYQDIDSQERFNSIILTPEGLSIESISLLETDYDNIDLYYNESVVKASKKTIKKIKNSSKGLTLIFGQRGTGKTNLINYIVSSLDKMVIFIPSTMIEHTINNPDFINLVRRYQNSIIVIDDCESLFTDIYRKSTLFVNNLLQLIDGYQSDIFSLNFILAFNIDYGELYDKSLSDCNNLISQIDLDELESRKVEELCEHLKYKNKSKGSAKVGDIIHKRNNSDNKSELGFN